MAAALIVHIIAAARRPGSACAKAAEDLTAAYPHQLVSDPRFSRETA